MKLLAFLVPVVFLFSASEIVRGDIVFFTNDAAGFSAANAGRIVLPVESFEGNTATGPEDLDDPLTQGVANGSFATGLVAPITVQSNIDGGSTTGTNPRGTAGLAILPGGSGLGNLTDVVLGNTAADSFDLILDPSDLIAGVGFNTHNAFGGSSVDVQVFDQFGGLLGTTTIGADVVGTNFLGIVTNGGDLIGRINIFDAVNGFEGVDNVQSFAVTVPEPNTIAILLIGGLGSMLFRKR